MEIILNPYFSTLYFRTHLLDDLDISFLHAKTKLYSSFAKPPLD